jgi:two-component system, sensor histidine kinase and response regulator
MSAKKNKKSVNIQAPVNDNQKKADETLVYYAKLLENISDAIISMDQNLCIISWNHFAREIYGWKQEEVTGIEITNLLKSDFLSKTREEVIEELKEKGCWKGELLHHHKNGKALYILSSSSVIRDDKGEITGYISVNRDITDRKESEEQIIKARDFYLSLFEEFPVLIWKSGIDGVSNYYNKTWLDYTGKTMEQELKDGWEAVVFPEDIELCRQKYENAFIKREPFEYDYRLRHKSGIYRWVLEIGSPYFDLDGEFAGYLGACYDISQQKKNETELFHSRQMLQLILDNIPQRIFWKDKNLNYLGCNVPLAKDAGLKEPAEIIGKNDFELSWKEIADIYRADDRMVIETNTSKIDYEEPQKRDDGTYSYLRTNKVPLCDEEGKVFGVLGTYEDITTKKNAEQAIVLNEERLNSMYRLSQMDEATPKELMDFTLEECVRLTGSKIGYLHFVTEDQSNIELFTWSTGVFSECNIKRETGFFPIENTGVWADCVRLKKPVIHNDYENLDNKKGYPEGHVKIFRHLSIPIFDGDNIVAVAGIGNKETHYDETDVRQVNLLMNEMWKMLQKSRAEKVRETAYSISELVHTTHSLDELYKAIHLVIGNLMPVNNIYIAIYNEKTDMISFPYFVDERDHSPTPRKPSRGLTEYVLRTGQPLLANTRIFEELIRKKEIQVFGTLSTDWLGVPLKVKDKTYGILVVQSYGRGIHYGELEKNMLIFVSEQIAMSIERKIAAEELLVAKQTAEESSRLKSNVLANMNHELRTPMTGILGFAELLVEDLVARDQKSMAENILISGQRLMATLNAIMDLSQIDAEKNIMKPAETEINHEIKNIVQSYKQIAEKKNLYLVEKVKDELFGFIDYYFLSRVIKNLVDNAIKFTHKGGVTITTELLEENNYQWAVIKVEDTGIGISPDHHQIIFEEFRQVSEGHSRIYEGTGLGLAICKKMIEMMNGSIVVESELGKGSVFTVKIPGLNRGIFVTEIPHLNDHFTVFSDTHKKAGETSVLPEILLVEDNQINIELTKIFLNKTCRIRFAKDGLTAIQMASEKIYPVILMDINLGPGIDGLMTIREIRRIPGYYNVPIIAVTGYASISDKERLLAGGCDYYLTKPFDESEIISLVSEILMVK